MRTKGCNRVSQSAIAIQQIQQKAAGGALLTEAMNSGLRAFFIIGALAVGLAMPGLVFYRRPVV
jgi:hypothetical protein